MKDVAAAEEGAQEVRKKREEAWCPDVHLGTHLHHSTSRGVGILGVVYIRYIKRYILCEPGGGDMLLGPPG